MMTPLLSFLGVREAECIIGDLDEELALLRQETTRTRAASWYAWQVSRLVARNLAARTASIAIVVAPPLILLQWLWTALFDYLCILPASGLLEVNGFCLLAGAALVLPSHRIFVLGLLIAGLALALVQGPATYPLLIAGMVAIPAGLFTAHLRKATA